MAESGPVTLQLAVFCRLLSSLQNFHHYVFCCGRQATISLMSTLVLSYVSIHFCFSFLSLLGQLIDS